MNSHKEHVVVLDYGALKCPDFEERSVVCKNTTGVKVAAPPTFPRSLELEPSLTS